MLLQNIKKKLFGDNSNKSFQLSPASSLIKSIHPDLQDLIWVADGPLKNYNTDQFQSINNQHFTIQNSSDEEPSLIYTTLPISQPENISAVNPPSYYPSYSDFTPEQRWTYLNFLNNPYDNHDIGYVFMLYYGLERHMLYGKFEQAFEVILKLRNVYDNHSFQEYSANSIILMCIFYNRPDLLSKFVESLGENDLGFNTFILVLLFLNNNILPEQLIKYSSYFGFTKKRYINSDYNLFLSMLIDTLNETYNHAYLPITFLNTCSINTQEMPIFANISLRQNMIKFPQYSSNEQLCQLGFEALQLSHDKVKQYKSEYRKKQHK